MPLRVVVLVPWLVDQLAGRLVVVSVMRVVRYDWAQEESVAGVTNAEMVAILHDKLEACQRHNG